MAKRAWEVLQHWEAGGRRCNKVISAEAAIEVNAISESQISVFKETEWDKKWPWVL